MTRSILLLLAACSTAASAQGLQQQTGPAPPPATAAQRAQTSSSAQASVAPDGQGQGAGQSIDVQPDGRCASVRPGDTVHYTLTVEGVEGVRAIYADLQLRREHSPPFRATDLPGHDYRSTGGGGRATADLQQAKMYHFQFKVQREIYGGVYHGAGVMVSADEAGLQRAKAEKVDVTKHTREQVKDFCLNVISNFGEEIRPEVVNFQPGAIDPPLPLPAPATPR